MIVARLGNLSTGPRAEDRHSGSINGDGLLAAWSGPPPTPPSLQGRRRQIQARGLAQPRRSRQGLGIPGAAQQAPGQLLGGRRLSQGGFLPPGHLHRVGGGADPEESWDSRCSAAPGRVLAASPASAPRAGVPTPPPSPHPSRPFLLAQSPLPNSGYSFDPRPGDPAPLAGEGSRSREEGDGLKAGSFVLVLHGWLPPSPPATLRVPAFPSRV